MTSIELRRVLASATAAFTAALITALAVPGTDARAQETTEESAPQEPEEIIVTATRSELPLRVQGGTVRVVQREDIELRQFSEVHAVLSEVPGLTVTQSSNAMDIQMRGASRSQTILMIDGMKMNVGRFQNIPLIRINTASIERIEVLQGPQSVLHGSEAAAGVVNIVTRRGAGAPHGEFSFRQGERNTTELKAGYRGSVSGVDFAFDAFRIDSDGYSDASEARGNRMPDPFEAQGISGRVGSRIGSNLYAELFFHVQDSETQGDGTQAGVPADSDNLRTDDESRIRVQLEHDAGGAWRHRIALSRTRFDRDGLNNFTSPPPFRFKIENRRREVDYQVDYRLREGHTLIAGFQSEREDIFTEDGNEPTLGADSVYAQYEGLSGRWFYSAGVRRNDNRQFSDETTSRLTAAYFLNPETKLKFSRGTGFRAPSVSDLFGSPLILGNPNLEGETSTGYEIGLERSFLAGALNFDATLFRLDIDDVIAVPGGLSQAVLPPENLDQARSDGLEFTARWQLRSNIQVAFNYTSTDATVKENGARRRRAGVPRDAGFVSVRIQPTNRTSIGGFVRSESGRRSSGKRLSGFTVVDLTWDHALSGPVSVFGRLSNVFDRRYEEVFGRNTPGRNLHVGLQARF
jgi:vitamin B12 transporter